MSNILDPQRVMKALEDGTIEQISSFFPLEGKKHALVADKIYSGGEVDLDDISSQKNARLRGRTWAQGLYGDFSLINKETGKTIDTAKRLKVASLPKITRRYSYIVDGTEYQVDNQWRLKSGVYTRRKANGELESQFNLAEGRGFRMGFDPSKRRFLVTYGSSNVQLLPVLQALGVPDDKIREAWGDTLYARSMADKKRGEVVKLAKVLSRGAAPANDTEAASIIKEAYAGTKLLPDTTKITLGSAFDSVNGDALLATSSKLLGVNRGERDVDNRDSLRFKELWSINDHIPERIQNSQRRIKYKLGNNVDRRDSVRSIITSDIFNIPIKTFFTSTSLSQQTSQVNPVDMMGGFLRTTIMGQGGIVSENAVSEDAKLIDSSYLGFIDPVHTPEGKRSGISGHLSLGVEKHGTTPKIQVYDVKEKKFAARSPGELVGKAVAFPDQYSFSGKAPKAISDLVTVVRKDGGDPEKISPSEVDYIIKTPKQLFSITANLVPFLPSDQANRAGMATRHLEQAISLKDREEPLVQVTSGNPSEKYKTWEKIVGSFTSHTSRVSGTVETVGKNKIVVRGSDGEKHEVPLYDNFPLNDKKAFISSTPTVAKGDKVKAGQAVADTNFTKNGTLAMGTNLRVAYLPYKGLVFEDGIVISETASNKLISEHLHKNRAYVEKSMGVGLKKFRANFPGYVTEDNAAKLDEDGVIKKGQKVDPGDVLMTVLQKTEPSKEQLLLKGIHKSLIRPYKNKSVTWDKPYTGVVTDVVRNGREIVAYVKTEESADVGDKLTGRHGNKGVITAVVPDEEMPRDADGNPVQLILNPSGVPGRINLGQVLETSLGKVAKKRGEPYAVENFQSNDSKKVVTVREHKRTVKTTSGDTKEITVKEHTRELGYQERVKQILAEEGVSETTELFDPETGKSLGEVLVGQHYTLKLMHQVDKKLRARAHGYGHDYDANLVPKGGGESGAAQRFGELGLYAMLAHGATSNIREALTYKSDKAQDEVWTAVQTGAILPAPKSSFAYEKFLAYMQGLGLNVEKEGNGLVVSPLTEKQIKEASNGEIKDGSKVIRGKDLKPEKGGLFDETVTGGPGGKHWAHMVLGMSMPNPMFEKSVRSLLGITGKQYDGIVDGSLGFDENGDVVPAADGIQTGPEALTRALGSINVDKDLASAKKDIKTARRNNLDKLNKKIKYLLMLKKNGLSPKEAYTTSVVPVLPPVFRPITAMEGGDLNIDGTNMLYRDIAILSQKLKESTGVLPEEAISALRGDLYDAVDALMGTSTPSESATMTDGQARPPGILTILSGRQSPKQSFFHKRILDRKQDISMRSVIVPNMDLHLDEIGLPRKGAMKIYRPFVVKELVRMGYTPLRAREEIEKKTPLADRALEVAVKKRPVFFKRDPVLHKFGIMAFRPKLHDESSIHIHPLVTGGFNADFDGDTMAVFLPVSQESIDEAEKLLPSKNLFNPATGKVMYQPTLEGQLGLFLLTQMGKNTKKSFGSEKEAIASAKAGDTAMSDVVSVGGKKTTAGRLLFNNALPSKVRSDKLLTDPDMVMGKKNLQAVLRGIATKSPAEFQVAVDKIKDLGFGHAYNIGFSFNLGDFDAMRDLREKKMKGAHAKEAVIRKQERMKLISPEAAEKKIIDLYTEVTQDLSTEAKKILDKKGNKLRTMEKAGVKPAWAQLQQMLIGPMLLENAKGRVIPVPVDRSYSEGLRSSDYWVASSGARKGLIEKVQSVQKPGALNKQLANTMMSYIVTADDCGTTKGIALDAADSDLVDRFTAKPISAKGLRVSANTALTPALVSRIKSAKVSKIVVKSPLKCEAKKGLCSKCYGLQDNGLPISKGTNIGVIAGTALGERGTQLSMKTFHTGGVAGSSGGVVGGIDRISQLLKMPATLPNAAVLSPATATVSSIKESPVGGFDMTIGNEDIYVPAGRTLKVTKGSKVKKGQQISSGVIDPRDLLSKTNVDTVQAYIADEINRVYKAEGIKRRNIEVVTKAITNLGRVTNPGGSDFIKNDYISISHANALNRSGKLKEPLVVEPTLRGIETLPLDQTTDWLARLQYRKLKETFIRAANEGWESDIHGVHPTPGIAYSAEFGKGKEGPY
jgi:DNA-directed RNA polymerase subunit beta'